VCDLEISTRMRRPWPTGGYCAKNKQKISLECCTLKGIELSTNKVSG
jgi:hypothetical protein